MSPNIKIFHFRFVDEVKNNDTFDVYEKSRLMMQAYNDTEKNKIITQTSIIQRMNQRFILVIVACTELNVYLRDITQIYFQSATSLNREFYIRLPSELDLNNESILKIIKLLYEMFEINVH